MPSFTDYSNFNADAAYSVVKMGAESLIAGVDLNEAQNIASYKVTNFINNFYGDGFIKDGSTLNYSGGNLTLSNDKALVNGELIIISSLTLALAEGETAYLDVWEEEVTYTDTIKKYGNQQETNTVTNNIKLESLSEEHGRRLQLQYNMVKTTGVGGHTYIPIATITSGSPVDDRTQINEPGSDFVLKAGDTMTGNLTIDKDQNGVTGIRVINETAGALAKSQIYLESDAGVGYIYKASSTFGTSSHQSNLVIYEPLNDILFAGGGGIESRFTSAGNLLLNKTSPDHANYQLDVAGMIHSDGNIIANGSTVKLYHYGVGDWHDANNEFISMYHDGSSANMEAGKSGTGTYRSLYLRTGNAPTLVLNADNNMGMSATIKDWDSTFVAFQIGSSGSLSHYADNTYLSNNSYYDDTDNRWERIVAKQSSQVLLNDSGDILLRVAETGAVDSAISWITSLSVQDSGAYSNVTGTRTDSYGYLANVSGATNNWGLYITADKNYISNHLGIGTTDIESWASGYRAIEWSKSSIVGSSSTNTISIFSNAYIDSGGYKYKATEAAAQHLMTDGIHYLRVASSGTIDTSITWITALKIETDGLIVINESISLKDNSGELQVRNAADSAYADLRVKNLYVEGTETIVSSETLEVADNNILLNSNVTEAPTEDAGITVERGTSTNASILWDETTHVWKMGLVGSETEVSLSGHNHDSDYVDIDGDIMTGNLGINTSGTSGGKLNLKAAADSYLQRLYYSDDTDMGGFYESSTVGGQLYIKDSSGTPKVKFSTGDGSYLKLDKTNANDITLSVDSKMISSSTGTHTGYGIRVLQTDSYVGSSVTNSGAWIGFSSDNYVESTNFQGTLNKLIAYSADTGVISAGSGAAITSADAYYAYMRCTSSNATITSSYLFRGDYLHTGGTITNKWGIHISGEAKNYISTHLGIGTTNIESWASGYRAIEFGGSSIFGHDSVTNISVASNAYYDSGGYKYKATEAAAQHLMATGTHKFRVAASGTVDTSITWADAMVIDVNGNIGIGHSDIESWNGDAIEFYASAIRASSTSSSIMMFSNAYYDGAYKYKTTAAASQYQQFNGEHIFRTVSSGTIDTSITWDEALKISGVNVSLPSAGSLELRDSDVAHGMTGTISTDAYMRLWELSATKGGGRLIGANDTGDIPALVLQGLQGATSTSDTAVIINGGKKNGTSYQALGDTESLFRIENGSLGSATNLFEINGKGEVGVGASPSAGFKFNIVSSSTNETNYGVFSSITSATSSSGAHPASAFYAYLANSYVASSQSNNSALYGSWIRAEINSPSHQGTFSVVYGSKSDVGIIDCGTSGTITNAYSYYATVNCSDSAATIQNAFGLGISYSVTAGTVTNRWGIYVNGEDKNYLSGNLGIGINTFGANLDKGIAIGNGTAPSSAPADVTHIWSEDIGGAAGKSCLHMMAESQSVKLVIPGVEIKTSTGDPSGSHESKIVINTFDNNIKMYADGGWRPIASW